MKQNKNKNKIQEEINQKFCLFTHFDYVRPHKYYKQLKNSILLFLYYFLHSIILFCKRQYSTIRCIYTFFLFWNHFCYVLTYLCKYVAFFQKEREREKKKLKRSGKKNLTFILFQQIDFKNNQKKK
jgi:hypothetical protein